MNSENNKSPHHHPALRFFSLPVVVFFCRLPFALQSVAIIVWQSEV